MDSNTFKIQRRNSLHQEVDGLWDDLEKEEDQFVEHRIKLNECSMLRRVLGADKADVLPKACKMVSTSQNKGFMSRLAGETPDVAGRVNIRECHGLFDTLQMVAGGSSFMPGACTAMLNKEQSDLGAKFEAENAKVYKRIARRNSWVAREDFPPTAT